MMHVTWEFADDEHRLRINDGERLVIGRSRACHVSYPHPSLSKRHAKLVRDGQTLIVRDLGSRNGVRVNGAKVSSAVLEEGDVVECGALRLVAQGIPAAPPEEELEASGFELVPDQAEPALCLRVVEGGPARLHPLHGERLVLGSADDADLVLAGKGISRRHAELVESGGEWRVRDLGARNGLFVNGQRVEVRDLREGDTLEIGVLRLRLEPAPPPGLLESVVHRFGAQSRARRLQVGGAAVALLLLGPALFWSFGGAEAAAAEESADQGLSAGAAALAEGRYAEATELLARIKRAASLDGRSLEAEQAEALRAVSAHWEELAEGPLQFRWERAQALLERAARHERSLPGAARTWLAAQAPLVELNKAAYAHLAAVDQALVDARAAQNLPAALLACEAGLAACERIAPGSAFVELAAQRRAALRAVGLAALEADVAARMGHSDPEWESVEKQLQRAEALADDSAARARIKAGLELCQVNRREAETFRRAFQLLQRGPEAREEAVRLLQGINPRAHVSAEARAVLAGLRAEEHLREAAQAYAQGDDRLALERLDEVFAAGDAVPADLKARAAEARRRCLQVKNGLDLARNLAQAGAHDEAEHELRRVLELESDPRNRFRHLAEQAAAHLTRQRREALETALARGEAALAEAQAPAVRNEPSVVEAAFARAREAFRQVRETRGVTEADLERVRRAARAEVVRLQPITADVRTGQSQRMRAHAEVCQLLLEWLPASDAERARAERALGEVQKELAREQRRGMTMGLAR